jgi:hypothetical protein
LFKAQYIDKKITFRETDATRRGVAIHQQLQKSLDTKQPTPPVHCLVPNELWSGLVRVEAQTEVKIAINDRKEECDFFADDVWLRGIADVLFVRGDTAVVIDWKTGKPGFTDRLQADVYSALVYATRNIQTTSFIYVYTTHDVTESVAVYGPDALRRVEEVIREVEADTRFRPKPGWKCRFCDLDDCLYNRKE